MLLLVKKDNLMAHQTPLACISAKRLLNAESFLKRHITNLGRSHHFTCNKFINLKFQSLQEEKQNLKGVEFLRTLHRAFTPNWIF